MSIPLLPVTKEQQEFIDQFNAENARQKLSEAYPHDLEFQMLLDRLPLPIPDSEILERVVKLDTGLGWTKMDNYDPYKSITYKLLTDPSFFKEYARKYKMALEMEAYNAKQSLETRDQQALENQKEEEQLEKEIEEFNKEQAISNETILSQINQIKNNTEDFRYDVNLFWFFVANSIWDYSTEWNY